jgi:predicted transcriptional regulator
MDPKKVVRRPYRNRMEIAAGILDVAKNGSRKTRIMYLGNLSFELVQKYLHLLTDIGLIEVRYGNGQKRYLTTEKGQQFLREFIELRTHLKLVEERKRELERALNPA